VLREAKYVAKTGVNSSQITKDNQPLQESNALKAT